MLIHSLKNNEGTLAVTSSSVYAGCMHQVHWRYTLFRRRIGQYAEYGVLCLHHIRVIWGIERGPRSQTNGLRKANNGRGRDGRDEIGLF